MYWSRQYLSVQSIKLQKFVRPKKKFATPMSKKKKQQQKNTTPTLTPINRPAHSSAHKPPEPVRPQFLC